MSITSSDILKMLSDLSITSDKIIEEDSQEQEDQVLKWSEMIKTQVLAIANYKPTSSTVEADFCIPISVKEIPSLDSFLKGPSERGRRLLSDVFQMAKDNLHKKKQSHVPKKSKSLAKSKLSESSTSQSDKKVNKTETSVSSEINKSDAQKETPLFKKESQMQELKKRKSSPEHSAESSKRMCLTSKTETNGSTRKSPRLIKLGKLAEVKKISSVPTNVNTSILKENTRLRSKETKVNENLKTSKEKEKSARKLKTDENKRKRDEKIEQIHQQKLQLEQEKIRKLRTRNAANSSKNETNLENKKKPNGREYEVKNTVLTTKNNSIKKVPNLVLKKVTNLKNQERKEKDLGKTTPLSVKKNGITSSQTVLQAGSAKNGKDVMNGTFLVKESSSAEKEEKYPKLLKEANSAITKDSELNSEKNVKKFGPHIEKLQSEKSKQFSSSCSTPVQKKNESYAITPVHSSFVSYDISEIKSDDSDDDGESNLSKPIPSWANGILLRNALLQQYHNPVNTDELFGNYFPPLDLNAMMGVKKKLYNKRTSSAIWNSSFT
ncbi:INCENP_ARK-bind domain-containing protein [Trichonephila inaurata madagascariensis]|uniref:INCENP_ARK-bind domain-containing protein n=1 Tax=Trichonephila inaurata madagascariensis TaxID=2747483 RepID=A0A8X6YKE5_9ARAC|nr:INCENP_ARK-bind domain-containing protein [Trichonephila inaurata madagascariensis]